MIDPNWSRWITSTLVTYFSAELSATAFVYVEGRSRPNPEPMPRFEFQLDGPNFAEVSYNYYYIDVEINILISSIKSEQDSYYQERLEGLVASKFLKTFEILKLGDDRNTVLGCLNLVQNISVNKFGLVDPTRGLNQSSVDGKYRMTLKV